ncbi:MAG: DsbA family protein [bacterium]|nr:DsbA family protein [bacterium]
MKKSTWIVSAIVVIGVGLLVFGGAQSSVQTTELSEEEIATILAIREDDWILSAPVGEVSTTTPEVTLVEYSDYQCPACKQYAPLVNELIKEFDGRVQLVYRHFPLTQIHFNARAAAMAAEAAGMQGTYFEMSDLLFEEQLQWQGLSRASMQEKLLEFASELELDIEVFTEDMASDTVSDSISQDQQDATRLGVNATPTFFLGGKQLRNPNSYDEFRLKIIEELGDITIETQAVDDEEFSVELGS